MFLNSIGQNLLSESFTYLFQACLSFLALYTVKRSAKGRQQTKSSVSEFPLAVSARTFTECHTNPLWL